MFDTRTDPACLVVEQLLLLRAAGAFDPRETVPGRGVWRWRFRAGGWPIDVDLDTTVLEVRVYHGRDEVAMGRVNEEAMGMLVGREVPPSSGDRPSAEAALAALRAIVADWKSMNARIFITPPVKAGHPDNWNEA